MKETLTDINESNLSLPLEIQLTQGEEEIIESEKALYDFMPKIFFKNMSLNDLQKHNYPQLLSHRVQE